MKYPLFVHKYPTNAIYSTRLLKRQWGSSLHIYSLRSAQQNDRKWKFPLFSVLRYVKQMFSFWGFWNFCFQFVSFGCYLFRGVLIFSTLQLGSRFSRRRLWSLKRFYRDCRRLLSRLRHMRLSQGTLRRDLHGCSSFVILYHHTFLILRGCHSPCHFSWWRRGHLLKGSSKNRKWLMTND